MDVGNIYRRPSSSAGEYMDVGNIYRRPSSSAGQYINLAETGF
jgi:hypothetical protein